MRLNALIARCGVCSRRGADALIAAGRVTVNGKKARLGASVDPDRDVVEVDGRRLVQPGERTTILLHKPAGYLVSRRDPHHGRTVYDLLPEKFRHLVPVGRLDLRTEGALLLTDDGELVERLTHPRYRVPKVYRALVMGHPSEEALELLRRGALFVDGKRTAPAQVRVVRRGKDTTEMELTLREGRKRQVRRMCEAIGHPVMRLRRIAFAGIDIEGLPKGKWRRLRRAEMAALRALTENADGSGH